MTPERLTELGHGYNLDCGGYEFERATYPEVDPSHAIVSIDSGFDYIDYCECVPWDAHVVLFSVGGGELPATLTDGDGDTLVRSGQWTTYESDHDCHCHGKPNDPTGAAGDTHEWEFTGNTMDPPYPKCGRCDGDGYVVSEGGSWAAYNLVETEDEED